jgi:hypothetical protein
MDEMEVWFMQVWSEKKTREFWDCACYARKPGDEKGVATFLDATPRLQWMSGKPLKEVWAYLLEQKALGRLLFSFTKENERLMNDLLSNPRRLDRRSPPSVPPHTRQDSNR